MRNAHSVGVTVRLRSIVANVVSLDLNVDSIVYITAYHITGVYENGNGMETNNNYFIRLL